MPDPDATKLIFDDRYKSCQKKKSCHMSMYQVTLKYFRKQISGGGVGGVGLVPLHYVVTPTSSWVKVAL